MRLKTKWRIKLKGADHCTAAGRMTSILRHVAEAFSLARQGTILNTTESSAVLTKKLRLSDLPNDDSRGRTAGCSLTLGDQILNNL